MSLENGDSVSPTSGSLQEPSADVGLSPCPGEMLILSISVQPLYVLPVTFRTQQRPSGPVVEVSTRIEDLRGLAGWFFVLDTSQSHLGSRNLCQIAPWGSL